MVRGSTSIRQIWVHVLTHGSCELLGNWCYLLNCTRLRCERLPYTLSCFFPLALPVPAFYSALRGTCRHLE